MLQAGATRREDRTGVVQNAEHEPPIVWFQKKKASTHSRQMSAQQQRLRRGDPSEGPGRTLSGPRHHWGLGPAGLPPPPLDRGAKDAVGEEQLVTVVTGGRSPADALPRYRFLNDTQHTGE